jgi:cytochrome P450
MQLATHPHYVQALRKEFHDNAVTYSCQRPWPFLDAIINESLRMWPSFYAASPRVTPPEGLTINNHFIPGDMVVQMPPFALFRDPRYFVRPDEFVPERWLDKPEMIIRKEAFLPFMTGPYSCAGKALAMMEMRSVIGRVISEFDVRLPEDFVAERYWEGIKDHVTAGPPKQFVRFVSILGE